MKYERVAIIKNPASPSPFQKNKIDHTRSLFVSRILSFMDIFYRLLLGLTLHTTNSHFWFFSEQKSHKHHHKHNKILAEHNNYKRDFFGEQIEPIGLEVTNKHKKKSRKSDDLTDVERNRKHGEKKKKKSKKEDKDTERAERKKRKKDRKNKSETIEDAFTVVRNILHEDAFEGKSTQTFQK